MAIDPFGCDSIFVYKDNSISAIGKTFDNDPNRYLVNDIACDRIRQLSNSPDGIAPMDNSEDVVVLPTKSTLLLVQEQIRMSNENQCEQGGHILSDGTITQWDAGARYRQGTDRNSITPFKVNGVSHIKTINVLSYWHIHPMIPGEPGFGQAIPSIADIQWDTDMRKYCYRGTTFVCGGANNDVTFYFGGKTIVTIPLSILLEKTK